LVNWRIGELVSFQLQADDHPNFRRPAAARVLKIASPAI